MRKKRRCPVALAPAVLVIFLLSGCGSEEVSYSVGGESCEWSESAETVSRAEFSDQAKSSSSDSGTAEDFSSSSVSESGQEEGSEGGSQPVQIQVYVCGAVVCPGVYTLPEGSRVYEAVAMAGGLLETAEPRALNQARLLSDGEQITVLTVEEVQSGEIPVQENPGGNSGEGGALSVSAGKKVNLNTADEAELMTLSGIGESRAKAIIAYREENGRFQSIEEIMKIDGIKEKMFEKIKDSITV